MAEQERYVLLYSDETKESASFNLLQDAVTAAENDTDGDTEFIIVINFDDELDSSVNIPAGIHITLISSGITAYKIKMAGTDRHFTVDGELTLGTVVLEGSFSSALSVSGDQCGGVQVNNGAVLNIEQGALITKCYSGNADSGGAVHVKGNGACNMSGGEIRENASLKGAGVYAAGIFTMTGGSISANITGSADAAEDSFGGGVYVTEAGTFALSAGEISKNACLIGAGVYTKGTFNMTGGSISANMISSIYATAASFGGGVYVADGEFTLDGGTINLNTANKGGGIYVKSGDFLIGDAAAVTTAIEIANNSAFEAGGGVYIENAALSIKRGSITSNTSILNGGGIYLEDGTIDIIGGSVSNNAALAGGGVYTMAACTMSGGSIDNNASKSINSMYGSGGGLYIASGSFEMSGGSISANTSPVGGGVYVSNGSFEMTGINASVKGNTATVSDGGGIYISTSGSTVFTAGEISANSATRDGGGIWIDIDELFSLSIAEGFILQNNKAFTAYTVDSTEIISWYTGNIRATSRTMNFAYLINNYDIACTIGVKNINPGKVAITGRVISTGAYLPARKIKFGIYDQNNRLVSTARNTKYGTINFSSITISAEGEYTFTVKEIAQRYNGWAYDSKVYSLRITAVENESSNLIISYTISEGEIIFSTRYSARAASTQLSALVEIEGALLVEGMFLFGLFDSNGREIARASNNASGETIFSTLSLRETGSYSFFIKALNQSSCEWSIDERLHPVTVRVTDNRRGSLQTSIEYPNGMPCFVHCYCSCIS
ncbi:MAG: hypothetical protein FWG30_08405 [Eubacteriaceae bacterium]|nr:hypothetical protein [Eubacteriaceae bacterium]